MAHVAGEYILDLYWRYLLPAQVAWPSDVDVLHDSFLFPLFLMNIGFYLGFYNPLFCFYSFITIPVVVLNKVVQNIHNILFILIEEKQFWTCFFLLLDFGDWISGLHSIWLFLFHTEILLSNRFFFLNFKDFFLINWNIYITGFLCICSFSERLTIMRNW